MNSTTTNKQLRQELLEKCNYQGLPAKTSVNINALKMYLSVDSKLDDIIIDLSIEGEDPTKSNMISQIFKLLPVKSRNRRSLLSEV
jgi:hypothetical protein